ncbi:MAG: alpha/beta hydrolase [Chloroflexi bacterium]|nr:alpha/beta hydrolase [Chloroflexota bacterium]MCC6896040.1 alpha/beta hydrolase [Anaerolineae bacterium]
MIVNQIDERVPVAHTEELVFAGDGVRLDGQMDYPYVSARQKTFPLMFILHHAGCDDREGYQDFAQAGLASGYAVFRWDKRGTGRSGAGGAGSTTQDAVNAYEVALEQAKIDRKRVVILAQAAGTGLLGDSYGLFARAQMPYGVVLATNALDEQAVLAIESRLLVMMGENDWRPWQKYGKAVCESHNTAYKHGAYYYVAPYADRMLKDPRTNEFHFGANTALQDWLQTI